MMKTQHQVRFFYAKQQGAALVISLILLAVVSVLAMSSSYRVNAELKAVGGIKERSVAFQAAEAALAIVEQQLANTPPPLEMLLSTCTGSGCYSASCKEGLCFSGEYLASDAQYECKAQSPSTSVKPIPVWRNPTLDVWNQSALHKTLEVSTVNTKVKYIVEFMCYVRKNQTSQFNADTEDNKKNGVPLFRITAIAESDSGQAKVALQSTYKLLTQI